MTAKNFVNALTMLFWPQCRTGRGRYVKEVSGLMLVLFIGWQALLSAVEIFSPDDAAITWMASYGIPFLFNLATIFLGISSIRRLHDVGLSGAWAFLIFVPVFNILLIVFCLAFPGTEKSTGWESADSLY